MKTYNVYLLYILIILATTFFFFSHFKLQQMKISEGFQQDGPFVLKQNHHIYDSFYAEIYDTVAYPERICSLVARKVIDVLQPSPEHSTFLCIGSGTGSLLNSLHENKFAHTFGLDKSQSMVDVSKTKYPLLPVKHGDVLDSMTYDRNSFTHIFCINQTFYEIEDKSLFFRNCYSWLQPNGYLILHLVNGDKYDPLNIKNSPFNISLATKYSKKRINKHTADFSGFSYTNGYKVSTVDSRAVGEDAAPNACVITQKETFLDKSTANIRENERKMTVESANSVLRLAGEHGFIVKGKIVLDQTPINDPHQFIYILERSH